MLNDKTVLITGGTGSFGHKFVELIFEKYQPKKVIILSRDEMKQWEMAKLYTNDDRVRFFIGDVRDLERLMLAFRNVDYVFHAAATKIVPTAEYNPFECIKTNINGAMNVIQASIFNNVKKVVALSTDKASSPINLYGATKLASDKLFVAANSYSGEAGTIFSVVRYGNVMGSRGSVIPFFQSLPDDKPTPVTDFRMTRFMISLESGVMLSLKALEDSIGGEIYVKKIPSMNIVEIANIVRPDKEIIEVGIRAGEKLHEQMIGIEDAPFTFSYEDYYKILPSINNWSQSSSRIKDGIKVDDDFLYVSDKNEEWMSQTELKFWLDANKNYVGKL